MPKPKKRLYDPNSEEPFYLEDEDKKKRVEKIKKKPVYSEDEEEKKPIKKNKKPPTLLQVRKKQGKGFWQADIGLEDE